MSVERNGIASTPSLHSAPRQVVVVGPRRITKTGFDIIFGLALVATCVVLFFAYFAIAYPEEALGDLPRDNIAHLLANVAANAVCMCAVYGMRGSTAIRIRRGLFAALAIHGALMLAILLLRTYYSRTIMPLSSLTSIGLATSVALVTDRWRPSRVGIVQGSLNSEVWRWLHAPATVINAVDQDVRDFDVVLVDWNAIHGREWIQFLSRAVLSGCNVQHIASYVEERSGRVSLDHFEACHAHYGLNNFYSNHLKRPLEMIVAVALSLTLFPFLLFGMIGTYLTIGRPIFFSQQRVGRDGRNFVIYKLRTMAASSDASSRATSVLDPRVTRFGKWLRRSRIDELPQLANVLLGQMSLIGPRPEQPALAARYEETVPGFAYRKLVLPGITGWAQVRAGYAANDEETRQKVTYDLYYLKHASFQLDVWIMFESVRAILLGTSAR